MAVRNFRTSSVRSNWSTEGKSRSADALALAELDIGVRPTEYDLQDGESINPLGRDLMRCTNLLTRGFANA